MVLAGDISNYDLLQMSMRRITQDLLLEKLKGMLAGESTSHVSQKERSSQISKLMCELQAGMGKVNNRTSPLGSTLYCNSIGGALVFSNQTWVCYSAGLPGVPR